MVYLLAPLGRGRRGDSSSRGFVGNGRLWWPENVLDGDGAAAANGAVVTVLRRRRWLRCWIKGGDDGDEEVAQGGWNQGLKILHREGERTPVLVCYLEREQR